MKSSALAILVATLSVAACQSEAPPPPPPPKPVAPPPAPAPKPVVAPAPAPAPAPAADAAAAPGATAAAPAMAAGANPVVVIETSLGNLSVELDQAKAPVTVKNFLTYVNEDFYSGTIFHRVINGFMIQGGGFTADMSEKPTKAPIVNEGQNGLKNARGTIAMARTNDLNSATAQFYINVVDNNMLNYPSNGGYAVFGKVIDGMETVDKIKAVPTGMAKGMRDVPTETVTIKSIHLKK